MSGGVGPTGSDISLPKDPQNPNHPHKNPQIPTTTASQIKANLLSFSHLNALSAALILASTGLVPLQDLLFVLFSLLYLPIISHLAFPSKPHTTYPKPLNNTTKLFSLYIAIGAIVGLYAPIAYLLEGTYEGDKEGIKAATPHLFLLASQVVMEGVVFTEGFSPPTRAFVPVFYNSRRIFSIVDWIRREMGDGDRGDVSGRRVVVGRMLAVGNMVFWCYNLFGFLLPVYLPRVFKVYHSVHKEKKSDE
ncbi:plant/K24M7-17 protein [Senna tora]|uniref:Plant/K24M7-17 protein n=1 Tax=Senna tora TaxID=362788 RepID=A0A834SYR4_9FABA|nr:plant/K24M7-17 protein [Senna tora]